LPGFARSTQPSGSTDESAKRGSDTFAPRDSCPRAWNASRFRVFPEPCARLGMILDWQSQSGILKLTPPGFLGFYLIRVSLLHWSSSTAQGRPFRNARERTLPAVVRWGTLPNTDGGASVTRREPHHRERKVSSSGVPRCHCAGSDGGNYEGSLARRPP